MDIHTYIYIYIYGKPNVQVELLSPTVGLPLFSDTAQDFAKENGVPDEDDRRRGVARVWNLFNNHVVKARSSVSQSNHPDLVKITKEPFTTIQNLCRATAVVNYAPMFFWDLFEISPKKLQRL